MTATALQPATDAQPFRPAYGQLNVTSISPSPGSHLFVSGRRAPNLPVLRADFRPRCLPGDHFFHHTLRDLVLEEIVGAVSPAE